MQNKNQSPESTGRKGKSSTDVADTLSDSELLQDDQQEPVLDEEDLEENDLTDEDVENIVWDAPKKPDEEIHNPENDLKV